MLTVVLLKISTVQQKLHIPRGDKLQRPSEPDYKHQNFGLLEFWNVLFILVFTLLKTFRHCMHWKAGFRFCGSGFFTTQELTHLMSYPCGAPLIDSIVYFPVVTCGMLLAAFLLGMLTLVKSLSFCSCLLSWLLAWHKPLFPSRPFHSSHNVWMSATPEPEPDSWVH